MKFRVMILPVIMLLICCVNLPSNFAQTKTKDKYPPNTSRTSPAAMEAAEAVKSFYTQHFKAKQAYSEKFQREKGWFDPKLYQLMLADDKAAEEAGEVGNLDFDVLTNAQEESDSFTVGQAIATENKATVPVTVKLGSSKQTIKIKLVKNGDKWQIADILYPENFTLLSILKQK